MVGVLIPLLPSLELLLPPSVEKAMFVFMAVAAAAVGVSELFPLPFFAFCFSLLLLLLVLLTAAEEATARLRPLCSFVVFFFRSPPPLELRLTTSV